MSAVTVLAGHYIDFGVISISVANAVVIAVMVVVFVLALVIPFPVHEDDSSDRSRP